MTDKLIPANSGLFQIAVRDGRARVDTVPAASSHRIATDILGLAPLYSGMFAPITLRTMGWLSGDDESIAVASRIFAGPTPWMVEIF